MNAEELKMAISPVVLRDEVTRLQAKEQLWYQDVEEREELAKLQLETLDALGAEIKRLHEIIRKYRKTERCMQLAGNLAGALKDTVEAHCHQSHCSAINFKGGGAGKCDCGNAKIKQALDDYDAMMKEQGE